MRRLAISLAVAALLAAAAFTYTWTSPSHYPSAGTASDIRNERLACMIVELVSRVEQVFVVGGSSHAVALKQALRSLWEPISP